MNFSVFHGVSIKHPLSSPRIHLQQQPPSERPNPNPNPNLSKHDEIREALSKNANERLESPLSSSHPNQRPPGNPQPDSIEIYDLGMRNMLEKQVYLDILLERSLEESAKGSECHAQLLIAKAKALKDTNPEDSVKCLDIASKILEGNTCNTIKLAEAYFNIGLIYKRMKSIHPAQVHFNRMIAIINQPIETSEEQKKADEEQAEAADDRSRKLSLLVRSGKFDEARALLYNIQPCKPKPPKFEEIEEALLNPDAEIHFQVFVILVQESTKESETRARVLIAMAISLFESAMFVFSKGCLQTASEILGSGKIEETINVAVAYGKIGMLYESMEEYRLAKALFERMVTIYNKQPQEERAKIVKEGIARAISLFEQKRFVGSKRCLKIASELLVNGKLDNTINVAMAYDKMGMLYERMGEHELAMSLFERMLAILDNYPQEDAAKALSYAKRLLLSGKEENVEQAISFLCWQGAAKFQGRLRSYFKFLGVAYIMSSRYKLASKMFAAMEDLMDGEDSCPIPVAALFEAHRTMKSLKVAVQRKRRELWFHGCRRHEIVRLHLLHLKKLKSRARLASREFHPLVRTALHI